MINLLIEAYSYFKALIQENMFSNSHLFMKKINIIVL